ncbi:MAG: hypothetical protein Q4F11_01215 [Eubacteriales bacterium]|nr:hypothetical protein [Eubacteriales bacterium]
MKKIFRRIVALCLGILACMFAGWGLIYEVDAEQSVDGYVSLDSSDPILFGGDYIVYQGSRIELGEKDIYLDGSLTDETADRYNYVYNDIKEALSDTALTDGTEAEPMNVYVAPYVYWIDDPDAVDTVEKTDGYGVPYGMVVSCQYLNIKGLTSNPDNVVFAGNRGQSHGANGNYTMFRFNGDGLTFSNVKVGNFCSIDLVYELKQKLNHEKRTATITQAQLGDVNGDKFFADNCSFVSRLNLDPMNGAKRSLYRNCHLESTDDALNGNAVYVNCDFDFYGNRPLYSTYNTGSAFLGCRFNCVVLNVEAEPNQYFTKEGGPVTAVDCSYTSGFSIPFGIGWTKYPNDSLKCYQYNILHNGSPITIGGDLAAETVEMTGKPVLDAYRIVKEGSVIYNTYNLLCGSDGWDPLGIKNDVTAAGADRIPTMLTVSTSADTIESGAATAQLSSKVSFFHGEEDTVTPVTYSLSGEYRNYAQITDNGDGTCTVTGINNEDEAKDIIINASTESGLSGAVKITVKPSVLPAPAFTAAPVITKKEGALKAEYTLDLKGRKDQSLISWYRCSDENGSNPILVAVSRLDDPMYEYKLRAGDIGYYIMAVVEPKDIRSNPGAAVSTMYANQIKLADVNASDLYTDFKNFPTIKQDQIIPGTWTVDYFRPQDTSGFGSWKGDDSVAPWVYGATGNGCVGYGLYQGTQGARLMYTPVEGTYGDMSLKLVVDPAKTAGQGFGSAGQYMDVCLKFDTKTLTGYGLRIIRTKAASNAATFVLVKYQNGETSYISEEVISSCYATGCTISLKIEGTKFTAHVETPTAQLADQAEAGYVHSVDLSADIEASVYGGVAIQHTGTTGTGGWQNTTMLHELSVDWAGKNNENPEFAEDINGEEAGGNSGEAVDDTVATGDTMNMAVWTLIAAAMAIVFAAASKKKGDCCQ